MGELTLVLWVSHRIPWALVGQAYASRGDLILTIVEAMKVGALAPILVNLLCIQLLLADVEDLLRTAGPTSGNSSWECGRESDLRACHGPSCP